jgi:hypothetical protein
MTATGENRFRKHLFNLETANWPSMTESQKLGVSDLYKIHLPPKHLGAGIA